MFPYCQMFRWVSFGAHCLQLLLLAMRTIVFLLLSLSHFASCHTSILWCVCNYVMSVQINI